MKEEKGITNRRIGITNIIQRRAKPYAIRLGQKEKQLIETLRVRWQLASGAKVLHRLLGIANLLEDKYHAVVSEQEELKKRYML